MMEQTADLQTNRKTAPFTEGATLNRPKECLAGNCQLSDFGAENSPAPHGVNALVGGKPVWVQIRRERGIELFGLPTVNFLGDDKPWDQYGAVAVQKFKHTDCAVYFIGGDHGPIKIGSTWAPIERLLTFQIGSPVKLRIFALANGGYAQERAYHARFAAHRLHGEWFSRTPEILAEIERLS